MSNKSQNNKYKYRQKKESLNILAFCHWLWEMQMNKRLTLFKFYTTLSASLEIYSA